MIYITRPSIPKYEDFCDEIKSIWETMWLTNMGEKNNKLQKEIEKYLGVNHVTLCSSGHMALENAISFFDFPNGSEVITSPFTFVSTTNAIVRNGLKPVMCDINSQDYTINENLIERLITEKTVAIVPIHVYGNVCNVYEIEKIAKKNNLKVIYDAAHAFGVTIGDRSVATFGDVSIFSFHATKVFNTVEGGAICYSKKEYHDRMIALTDFGIYNDDVIRFGANSKLSEFHAAMGLCNLKSIDSEIQKRKEIVERYYQNLSGIKGIYFPQNRIECVSNFSYFPVLFDGYKYNRDDIYRLLYNQGIRSRKYFCPLTNEFSCYHDKYASRKENTAVAQYVSSHILTLPLYADLDKVDVDSICSIITK